MSNESKGHTASGSVAGDENDRLSLAHSARQSPRLILTPAVHEFDPFNTLPTNELPHQSSESLLQYCESMVPCRLLQGKVDQQAGFDVLLPLTFCVEKKYARDRTARQGLVLSSKVSNPASFLGFLATTAAHRAVMYGRHKDLAPSSQDHDDLILDPDYARVKHEAMVAVRQAFGQRPVVDEQMIEASFGLIATATVVGNFQEARMHLKLLDRLTSQIEFSEQTLMWLPVSIVKVSIGLLERPVMPLLIKREPIPDEVLRCIAPQPLTRMVRLGHEFWRLDTLSPILKSLLSTHKDICHLCEFNATDPRSSPLDSETLRKKAIELEFDLVAYPYDNEAFLQKSGDQPEIPLLEEIVRLAALGMLSIAPHTIMPATGNGRAITHYQKRALEKWLGERQSEPIEVLGVLCWALFVFTQNALKQPEETFFVELLAQFSRDLWLSTWEDIESVILGFLYIPGLQSSTWKTTWEKVCRVRKHSRL